ncbi:hypothetical protein SPBR_03864 [Sporothrix brasiliensis 5110]|uniref:Fungal N-terminal domain-containing protein n=1 Tax=Sporothrix brasiliensis 5110 TaxID=1398154 RepID=A0A0C2J7D3_9PEZI|nr:uncharacterized protein SPBR_03864 [Sporothrix brasiliensis 5110]KIH94905.1 hypothetical protein SPBR_03864 [Sporothrix brasiliensis 5110]
MDPITALSVAAAAGQFVSFAYDLAKGTAERYRSIEGTEKRLLAVAADAKHINELLDALSTPNDVTGGTGSFVKSRTTSTLTTKLDAIVQECHAVGVELQTLLDSTTVQPSEKRRMVQSTRRYLDSTNGCAFYENMSIAASSCSSGMSTCTDNGMNEAQFGDLGFGGC